MADWNVTYPDIVGGAIDTYHKSVDNYQKAQTNLMAIKEARKILENQKQNFDIQKKMNNLNLESLGLNNQLTRAELEEKKQSINLQNKLQDQYFKGIDAATIMGEAEAKKTAENSLNQGMVAQTVLGEAKNRGWLENLTPEIVNGKISLKRTTEITPYQKENIDLRQQKIELERQKMQGTQEQNLIKQEELKKVQEAKKQNIVSSANQGLDAINNLLSNKDLFGARSMVPALPGTRKADFDANFEFLKGKQISELINELKSQSRTGATGLGALNKEELRLLESASTQLRKNLSGKDAEKYLNVIKDKYLKVTIGNSDDPAIQEALKEGYSYAEIAKFMGV